MDAPAKNNEIDPLLHPAQVAKLLQRVALLVGQVPPHRHWPALHQDWPSVPLCHVCRARIHLEPAAPVDE
jgi:hypothetical protein